MFSDYPTEAEMDHAAAMESASRKGIIPRIPTGTYTGPVKGYTDLSAWVRCDCDGSCGVDLPVTLRTDGTDTPPWIVAYPSVCPDTKRALHQAPTVSPSDRWRAWYDAVNAAVSEDMVSGD